MIENVEEKLASGQLDFDFAASGAIAIIERQFNQRTGVPEMVATRETNSAHIRDLIADHEENVIAPAKQKAADLKALLKLVAGKEAERAAIEEKNAK